MFETEMVLGVRAGEPTTEWDEEFDDLVHRLTEEALAGPHGDEVLPRELEDLPPIMLAALLHGIHPGELSGHDQIRLLQARERLVSHNQAGAVEAIDAISHFVPPPADDEVIYCDQRWEYASDEIRAALRLTRYGAERRVAMAASLVDSYPHLLELLRDGRIDLHRVRVIVDGTTHLDPEEKRAVVDSILSDIPELTSGELRSLIRKLCVEAEPERARRRYEQAVEDRRVWIEQTDDGTANLHAIDLPIDRARAIGRHLNGYALSLKNSGDTRSMDQLRSDVLCDLLDGKPGGRASGGTSIDLRVDLATLAQLADRAGEIPGLGPIAADIARQIAGRNTDRHWQFTVVDDDGNVIDTGLTRRRFSPAQRRLLGARYETCGFPGCRMPASDCDFDHTRPFAHGGPTGTENGTPECRHDHILIHEGGWKHFVIDGQHHWVSPLGHRYVKKRPP